MTKKTPWPEQLQWLNFEIDARRGAEITVLRRLIPWLAESERRHLRLALRLWCGAAREYLKNHKAADSDLDFALVKSMALCQARNVTLPQHRRLIPELISELHHALDAAKRDVPGHCPRRLCCALALVLDRIGMTDGDEHV